MLRLLFTILTAPFPATTITILMAMLCDFATGRRPSDHTLVVVEVVLVICSLPLMYWFLGKVGADTVPNKS